MEAFDDSADRRHAGEVLAAERERQGLARGDVAQRLRMSVSQVEALEEGAFERLPRGPFLRGFVRNYAKVLGLVPESLLARLAEGAPREVAPGIVVPSQNIRFDPSGQGFAGPYARAAVLAVVAVAIALAAIYWWIFIRPTPPGSVVRKPAAETARENVASAPPVPPPVAERPAAPAPAPAPEKSAAENVPQPAPAAESVRTPAAKTPAPSPVAAKPVAAGDHVIRMQFKGASWVEVRDARGRVLTSKVNDAGSENVVSGAPPFKVIVGNAPEVKVLYDEREFDLEPHTRVAVARFTLE